MFVKYETNKNFPKKNIPPGWKNISYSIISYILSSIKKFSKKNKGPTSYKICNQLTLSELPYFLNRSKNHKRKIVDER